MYEYACGGCRSDKVPKCCVFLGIAYIKKKKRGGFFGWREAGPSQAVRRQQAPSRSQKALRNNTYQYPSQVYNHTPGVYDVCIYVSKFFVFSGELAVFPVACQKPVIGDTVCWGGPDESSHAVGCLKRNPITLLFYKDDTKKIRTRQGQDKAPGWLPLNGWSHTASKQLRKNGSPVESALHE